jgi:hypothetical protein
MVAVVRKPLEGAGFDTESNVVDVACKAARGYELGVEVVRTSRLELGIQMARHSAGTARGDAVDLHYRVEGEVKTLRVPFSVTLCAPGETSPQDC